MYKISDELVIQAAKESKSVSEVLRKLGMSIFGHNHLTIKRRIKDLGIDTSHFLGQGWSKGKKGIIGHSLPDQEVFRENSSYLSTNSLKKKILKNKLLEYKCSKCGLVDEWIGEKLVLHLEHKNGTRTDNRLENLEFLCPNCHSQTKTYCRSKSSLKEPVISRLNASEKQLLMPFVSSVRERGLKSQKCFCEICKCEIRKRNIHSRCKKCYDLKQRKVNRPSKDELSKLVWEKPTSQIAKDFGVSDNAISKWCYQYNIEKPPRGYWEKKYHGKL